MVIETKEGLKLLKGINGDKVLFINSTRIAECIDYMHKNNIKHISINPYQGYADNNINFLLQLANFLEGLSVLDEKYDYSIINRLHNLKSLGLSDNKKNVIDLLNFPQLEHLGCDYSLRLQGLKSCEKLISLSMQGYKSKNFNLEELAVLPELRELLLIKPVINNLNCIERFTNLKKLNMFLASKLENIGSIQLLSNNLEEIELEQCKKINDYETLGKVQSLRKLIISESGDIKSLAFVKELSKLKFISFWGVDILDGNLSYCEGINYVAFQNKKHYSHRSEQFNKFKNEPG